MCASFPQLLFIALGLVPNCLLAADPLAMVLLTRGMGEKRPFLRCSWEAINLLLSAVSSALDLLARPFGWVHILVSSGLKI